jgi:hypothetical protein
MATYSQKTLTLPESSDHKLPIVLSKENQVVNTLAWLNRLDLNSYVGRVVVHSDK